MVHPDRRDAVFSSSRGRFSCKTQQLEPRPFVVASHVGPNVLKCGLGHDFGAEQSSFVAKSTDNFPRRAKFGNVRPVEIVYEHHDVICALQEPVFVLWWRNTPTIPQAQHAFDRLQVAAKALPGGVVFVVVAGDDVSQPDRATADFFARSIRAIEKHVLAHAFVLEGTGLKSSAIRAVLRTIQTMSRVIFPWTISPSVDEGMLFLAKRTGFITEPEARALCGEIAKLRVQHALKK